VTTLIVNPNQGLADGWVLAVCCDLVPSDATGKWRVWTGSEFVLAPGLSVRAV
jgi:hypothetical protein